MTHLLWVGVTVILLYFALPNIQAHLGVEPKENTTSTTLEAGLSDEQWLFLQDVAKLITYAEEMGYKLTAGEIYRTLYQQRENVRKGVSWTYNSKHLKRLAIDLNLFIDGHLAQSKADYLELGRYWESLSEQNRWGGRFNDAPHFERMLKPRTSRMKPL